MNAIIASTFFFLGKFFKIPEALSKETAEELAFSVKELRSLGGEIIWMDLEDRLIDPHVPGSVLAQDVGQIVNKCMHPFVYEACINGVPSVGISAYQSSRTISEDEALRLIKQINKLIDLGHMASKLQLANAFGAESPPDRLVDMVF